MIMSTINNLKKSSQKVQEILQSHNLDISVIEFPDTTRTSQEAASVIGCEVAQIAKTLIFKGKKTQQPICIIASGKNRVDENKVEQYVGEAIERPDADYVLQHTGFVIGGVSPVGYQFNISPLIDEDLLNYEIIWAAAGTPFSVFKISPQDLIKITQGKIVNIRK